MNKKEGQSPIIFQKKNSRGQSQISFGMIFAIILIVIFIIFAIYGVVKFLGISRLAQVQAFKSDFQTDITNMWTSTQGTQEVDYSLPRSIKQVCFANRQYENMYFVPDDFPGEMMDHLNITGTIAPSTDRPKKLCISTSNGKIYMIIKKASNQALVTVTK